MRERCSAGLIGDILPSLLSLGLAASLVGDLRGEGVSVERLRSIFSNVGRAACDDGCSRTLLRNVDGDITAAGSNLPTLDSAFRSKASAD